MENIALRDMETALSENDWRQVSSILFSLTLRGNNYELAMALCRRCLKSEDPSVRANAIQALGHTAYVFGKLDADMKEVIEAALQDPNYSVRTQADMAASSASGILKWKIKGWSVEGSDDGDIDEESGE